MHLESLPIARRLAIVFGLIGLIAGAAFAMVLVTKARLDRTARQVGAELSALWHASESVQLRITQAHLVFEEIMAGDDTETVAEVRSLVGRARELLSLMLEGGMDGEVAVRPAGDPQVRAHLEAALAATDGFLAAVEERYRRRGSTSDAGSEIEIRLEEGYDIVLKESAAAGRLLHAAMADGLARLAADSRLASLLPVLALVMMGSVLAGSWLVLRRSVAARLADLSRLAGALAGGDVAAARPAWRAGGEIGDLAERLEAFRAALARQQELERIARVARDEAEAKARESQLLLRDVEGLAARVARGELGTRRTPRENQAELVTASAGTTLLVANLTMVLDDIAGVMAGVAEGDLTRRMRPDHAGAFRELALSVDTMCERVGAALAEALALTGEIRDGAARLRAGSSALAARAENQAASLEETSATMEEIAARVRSTADRSTAAETRARETAGKAAEGAQVVAAALRAMQEIEDSSHRVTDIIGVIDSIAFQTNLLALNAAVEAARAGDAGKGFAVVASEVRSLAQRTSVAARDISNLIRESSARVQQGVQQAQATGQVLEGIRAAIAGLGGEIGGIAGENRALAAAVQDVRNAIRALDEITQQNSGMAEETAATTRHLDSRVNALAADLSAFRFAQAASDARSAAAA
jgi:methyl-accepting chemotaxis protein